MIFSRAYDPIPFLIAWVHVRVGEVPANTGIKKVIIPVRSISGVIYIL
jgi:hypothetical protein